MSTEKIRKIKRIRSIDERTKDLTAMEIGKLDQRLRELALQSAGVEKQFERINGEIDTQTATLTGLTQVFCAGVQQEKQANQIEQSKAEISRQRNQLVQQLREQQVRIDQWDKLLEKLEMEVAAEEARKSNIAADESFLASHLRGKA